MTAPAAQADGAPAPRVVVAEDEALLRVDLVEMLTEEGYEVVADVADGSAAVEAVRRLRPDVLLLDVRMPGGDGLTAAEELVAERTCAVVVATAFSQRDLVERARRAGALGYLVKPFTARELVPALELARSRFAELTALESEVGRLADRLEVRTLVDRAKARLMAERGLSEADAFRSLQRRSMDERTSLREVATAVLEAGQGRRGDAV